MTNTQIQHYKIKLSCIEEILSSIQDEIEMAEKSLKDCKDRNWDYGIISNTGRVDALKTIFHQTKGREKYFREALEY
jgi:hypothetical protein